MKEGSTPEQVPKGELSELIIQTMLGATYVFPDFDTVEAVKLVSSFPGALRSPQLTLVNVSGACLVLPTRVIRALYVTNTLLSWMRPT